MKTLSTNRGGRRTFHVILFILSLFIFGALVSTTKDQTCIPTIEYRSPEEIETEKIYNLVSSISNISNDVDRYQLADAVRTYGTQYSIDPILLLAISRVESSFTKDIEGPGNCWGYFQINLNVHNVSQRFLLDTYQQAKWAATILSQFKNINNNHEVKSLNGYNGYNGMDNPYAYKVLSHYREYKILYKEM